MKRTLLIVSLLVLAIELVGQNLIPNPSFEDHSSLPTDLGQFSLCDDWSNCSSLISDPDFYHRNASLLGDLPVTSVAEVSPLSGDAIMGFVATGKQGSNYREYISMKLSSPTVAGSKYNVTFNITNGHTYDYSLSGLGTSQIGISLSNSEHIQNGNDPINVVPHYETFDVVYDRGWKRISFSFIANSSLEWLTLGVFNDDSDLNIDFMDGNANLAEYAYYFVDDFSVENIPLEHLEVGNDRDLPQDFVPHVDSEFPFFVPNAFTPDGNGNNDSFAIIVGQRDLKFTITVFDRWGNQIYKAVNGNPEWDGKCNGEPCPSDIYVWHVQYLKKDAKGKEVSSEETGTIHLIR